MRKIKFVNVIEKMYFWYNFFNEIINFWKH